MAARSLASAQAFAQKNGIPSAYGSYAELVQDPAVQVCYIGTIHPMHKSQALLAIEAGKHVLCEKPLTCSSADTKELIDAAAKRGVLLQEALWTRFFPTVRRARDLIAQGAIGEVVAMHGDFGFRFPGADSITDHRLTDPKMAGGATLDIGVYPLSCMLLAFGAAPPLKISAAGALTEATGVDKSVGVTTVHQGGRLAHMTWSIDAQTPEEWRVIGSRGMIIFDGPAHAPLTMRLIKQGASRLDPPTTEVITPPPPVLCKGHQPINFPGSEGFIYQAKAVTEAVRTGKLECEEFTHEESLAMASICDEVLRQVGVSYPAFD